MKSKPTTVTLILLVLILSIIPQNALIYRKILAQKIATLYVDPQSTTVYKDQIFTVTITISNVTDLHSVDLKLEYDTTILDATNLQVITPWPENITEINDPAGYVLVNSTLPPSVSLNGTTTVASITFKAINPGNSILTLRATLLNSTNELIPFVRRDGEVTVKLHTIKVPSDCPTIQEAINFAEEGYTIYVLEGIYNENIVINKSLTIIAENSNTIINATSPNPTVNITTPNVNLIGFTIINNQSSISINIMSGGNKIQNNIIISRNIGIKILQSKNNFITKNTITNCSIGLLSYKVAEIYILSNEITKNTDGIMIQDSMQIRIENNKIQNNTYAIKMLNSTENKIARNEIYKNEYGLILSNSTNNYILRNNLQNTFQLSLENSTLNTWDNGVEGNYWSDYTGQDANGDGIGDTELPCQGVDYHPLMNPYISGDVNHDGYIDSSDLGVLGTAWNSLPSDPSWNPCCDLNEDEAIDSSDLGMMGINWAK